MKKKYMYTLLTTYMATLGALVSCNQSRTSVEPKPKTSNTTYFFEPPKPKIRVDTLDITDANFEQATTEGNGGQFFPKTNTIVIYYFNPISDNARVAKFCNTNNNMHRLFVRHEMEHARKQYIVYNTDAFSKFACGEISVANEVSSRIAEIIEAVDYHARTGERLPCKTFISHADSAISTTQGVFMPGYVNYNYQPVADAVLTYALEGFLHAYNRNFYHQTICYAYNRRSYKKPQSQVTPHIFFFNPDLNQWDPMWDFESNAGDCNPYRHASPHIRQKFIQTIDSIVCDATGADFFMPLLKNNLLR